LQKYHTIEKTLSITFIGSCYFDEYPYVEVVANGGNSFSKGDLIMRKVLLATTALVAMSVTAASADVSIGGSYRFQYQVNNDAANASSSDGNITIKSSATADNGVTYGVVSNNGIHTGNVEDAYLSMSGDFGLIKMGMLDSALDDADGILVGNQPYKGAGYSADSLIGQAITVGAESNSTVNFASPSMNGMKFVASFDDTAGESGYGISYSTGIVSMIVQTKTGGDNDETNGAIAMSVAGVGLNFSTKTTTPATGTKTTNTGVAGSYSMGGINLVASSESAKQGTRKDSHTSIGATYTVAPGVTAAVEQFDDKDNGTKSSGTFFSLNVGF
jgi:hypothetical protein